MNRRTLTKSMMTAAALGGVQAPRLKAQTPEASAMTLVDVSGAVLALSPDGSMAAGMVDREFLRVWDVETLDIIAESDPDPEMSILDQMSLTWSPDGTALAWSLDAARLMRDSDIFLFDIATATTTNLTDDAPTGEDAVPLLQSSATPGLRIGIDVFPSWSHDGADLFFARSPWGDDAPRETRLMRIARDSGEASEVALLSGETVFLVSGPMFPLADDSVLYATWPPDIEAPEQGVFLAMPDGSVEGISTGMLAASTPSMHLVSVAPHARKATAISLRNYAVRDRNAPIWIELDLDTGIPTAFETVLSLPTSGKADEVIFASPAFLLADDGGLVGYLYATADTDHDEFSVWRHDLSADEAELIATVANPGPRGPGITQYPRVEVTSSGSAALLYAGNLWIIDLG